MRHSRAYKEAMFALGITELFEVKKILYTDKADMAIEALTGYAAATVALKEAEDSYWNITAFTFPDLEERLNEMMRVNKLCRTTRKLKYKYRVRIGWLVAGKEPEEESESESDVEEGEENYEDLNEFDHEDD